MITPWKWVLITFYKNLMIIDTLKKCDFPPIHFFSSCKQPLIRTHLSENDRNWYHIQSFKVFWEPDLKLGSALKLGQADKETKKHEIYAKFWIDQINNFQKPYRYRDRNSNSEMLLWNK